MTTDFGISDGYQGVLEGIIAGINPDARVVTISHDVRPGDIPGGWYLLKTHYPYFPPGTVHLAVVDPGVGGRRRIIVVATDRYKFIAPDNGLLSFIPADRIHSIHSVTNRKYALREISPVFHGRDIIAPAAAYLSLGVAPSCLGRAVTKNVSLSDTEPRYERGRIVGRILWVDKFGNIVSNIPADKLVKGAVVRVAGSPVGAVRRTFSDVRKGQLLAYVGSGGHLEIAVRNGSAWERFSGHKRDTIEIEVAQSP